MEHLSFQNAQFVFLYDIGSPMAWSTLVIKSIYENVQMYDPGLPLYKTC
jgi:hypothetical protein